MENIVIGKFISEKLTGILSKHTTLKDAAAVGEQLNISSSIILKIKNGSSRVTEANYKAINKLAQIAYTNIENSEREVKRNKKQLKQILQDELSNSGS